MQASEGTYTILILLLWHSVHYKGKRNSATQPYIAPIINLIDPVFTVNPLGRAQEQWLRLMKELQGTDVPESQLCDIMTSGLDLQVALQL